MNKQGRTCKSPTGESETKTRARDQAGCRQGRAWLDEVHRILKPGGVLFFTVHGLQSVFVNRQRNWRDDVHVKAILEGLYARGYYFFDSFGKGGDWGVVVTTPRDPVEDGEALKQKAIATQERYTQKHGPRRASEGMMDTHALAISAAQPGTVFLANRLGSPDYVHMIETSDMAAALARYDG